MITVNKSKKTEKQHALHDLRFPRNPRAFIPKQLVIDEQNLSKQGIFLGQLFYWQAAFCDYKERINYFIIYLKR